MRHHSILCGIFAVVRADLTWANRLFGLLLDHVQVPADARIQRR